MKQRTPTLTMTLLLALLILLATATGCHTPRKTVKESQNHIRADTTKTEASETTASEVVETTIIKERPTEVELPVPQAHLERETSDTTSTLQTDIYRSTATVKDGKLHHTLESLPGATIKGQATVADTTKLKTQNTLQKSEKTSTHNTIQSDTKEQLTQKTIIKWPWWAYTVIAAATAALLYFIHRATRRRKNR